MQMLYLLPPAILLWRTFEAGGGALNLLVPVLVMAAGQLAGGLAWLSISGEDAPDLVATAPIPQRYVLRAKIEAVIGDHRRHLCAAGRGHRHRLAVARRHHRRRHCDRGRLRHRHPALVPHPSQAQPIPPPPGLLARRHLRRGFFLDRLGCHRRCRRRQSLACDRPRRDRARRRHRHVPPGAASTSLSPLRGERVGVRGPLCWARRQEISKAPPHFLASLRLAERPPHPRSLRSLDLSPRGGER
jgi:hypothetical protein